MLLLPVQKLPTQAEASAAPMRGRALSPGTKVLTSNCARPAARSRLRLGQNFRSRQMAVRRAASVRPSQLSAKTEPTCRLCPAQRVAAQTNSRRMVGASACSRADVANRVPAPAQSDGQPFHVTTTGTRAARRFGAKHGFQRCRLSCTAKASRSQALHERDRAHGDTCGGAHA